MNSTLNIISRATAQRTASHAHLLVRHRIPLHRTFSHSAQLHYARRPRRGNQLEQLPQRKEQPTVKQSSSSSTTTTTTPPPQSNNVVDDPYKIEVINFPGVGGGMGGGSGDGEITERQADILQSSVDKLAKRFERLDENVRYLNEAVGIMSTSVQMLAEQHINSRVISILRQAKLVSPQPQMHTQAVTSTGESSASHIPFVRVNNEQRIEDFLRIFVRDCGVVGAEQAVHQSVRKQSFVDFDGQVISYSEAAPASSGWITTPMGGSKGGRHRKMISGEVTVVGNSTSIARALHRAMRIPVLLRRYTSRIHKALYRSSTAESLEGMEGITVFAIVGSVHPSDCCIAPRFFNKVLSTDKDFDDLEDHILQTFDGELAMLDDEEILESEHLLNSDPLRDATGVWKLFHETTWNDTPYEKIPADVKDKVALLVLLRMARLCKFNVFFGSVLNPLG